MVEKRGSSTRIMSIFEVTPSRPGENLGSSPDPRAGTEGSRAGADYQRQ